MPFSPAWWNIRHEIKNARLIYTKLEVNETLLLLYFGGFSTIRKTIIGLHSPFYYSHTPKTFFEKLHNVVYGSPFCTYLLSKAYKVHVLSPDQDLKLTKDFGLTNVIRIPNYIEHEEALNLNTDKKQLKVCFVGELNLRKGADILLNIMKQSPSEFSFDIAGDGPLKEKFTHFTDPRIQYHGYLKQNEVSKLINNCDVLLMPSRAESFSLVSLEALSDGLTVICSSDISPNELEKYLVINTKGTVAAYLEILQKLFDDKKAGLLKEKRKETATEMREKYSKKVILKLLHKKLFGLGS